MSAVFAAAFAVGFVAGLRIGIAVLRAAVEVPPEHAETDR